MDVNHALNINSFLERHIPKKPLRFRGVPFRIFNARTLLPAGQKTMKRSVSLPYYTAIPLLLIPQHNLWWCVRKQPSSDNTAIFKIESNRFGLNASAHFTLLASFSLLMIEGPHKHARLLVSDTRLWTLSQAQLSTLRFCSTYNCSTLMFSWGGFRMTQNKTGKSTIVLN